MSFMSFVNFSQFNLHFHEFRNCLIFILYDRILVHAFKNHINICLKHFCNECVPVLCHTVNRIKKIDNSIGFLNFTLFEDQPEFFATYELRNKKTGHLYSSKFSIHVLDLTLIDLATEEDIFYEIDRWAKLFKAKTWEELRMVAKNNPDLLQASNDLYTVNADEIIRQQARARADAEFWERNKNAKIKRLEDTIVENQKIITENQKMLAEKDAELLRLQKELAELKTNRSSMT